MDIEGRSRMHTHFLLLLLSLLSACTSIADPVAQASSVEPLPGLPGASGPHVEGGKYVDAPEGVVHLLMSLPIRDILVSESVRQRYLEDKVLVKEVQGGAGPQNYLVVVRNESSYGFWIRSFQGTRRELTGYLVQVQGLCAEHKPADPVQATAVASQCRHGREKYFDSGMRAYRVVEGQPPEDVTASIAPDPANSSKAMREHYASVGASSVFADDMNLDKLPIFRWVVEYDRDQPAPISDPHSFYYGHMAHAGFVVWDGERFENRKTVPRALWPCEKWLDDDGRVLPCPDATPEGDRFISDDK
ncbi:MAG: hypothetical protein ABIO17_11385 [Pseudoxanthomonas sp.]